ncbi:uncharacterized protein LOC131658200 [Vicia villosa]|uniref:uncharacterized protein LOC131658200 n=1 Tax=Vicia villosa TaxID=3911 RepID=UPI00273C9C31|nr:uncharacterized protein LOC131658200 [Vicia villosa]
MEVIPILESPPLFQRLHVCLDACKKGFKAGCRPLIGLDGCFLKGYYGGQLLSAVAQDANNQFYVIAYAVVDSETKDNCKWFLTLLESDIGDHVSYGWNFISDQQKGLLPALKEAMPLVYHRNCVLHIWKNFIKQYKDKELRGIVWQCAKSTTEPEFNAHMEKLKTLNEKAWSYLYNIDKTTWVKAYFSHWPKLDNITNNMCEVWNNKIVKYREKPILTMMEELRCYLMRRMASHKRVLGTCKSILPPVQQRKIEKLKVESNKWTPQITGDDQYEVRRHGTSLGVNLDLQTCICQMWQLTGMPCIHAIAAIAYKVEKSENYVHQWLTMEALNATYDHYILPVNSQEYWKITEHPKPEPPKLKRPIGRPKKHRRKNAISEDMPGSGTRKVKRRYEVICPKCGEAGHYEKTCKGPPKPGYVKKNKKLESPQPPVVRSTPIRPSPPPVTPSPPPVRLPTPSFIARPSTVGTSSIRPPTGPSSHGFMPTPKFTQWRPT